MQRLKKVIFPEKILTSRLMILILFFGTPLLCHGANDLLMMPAQESDLAPNSILMDVVNVGGKIVAVGERGHILYSNDSCTNFNQAVVPVSVTLTAVYFPSDQHGWAVGHDGVVLHTSDGGKTWEKQLDGNQINDLMLLKLKEMIAGKRQRLENDGAQLEDDEKESLQVELEELDFFLSDLKAAVEDGPIWPLMDVWFKNEREGLVIGSFGIILRTVDGGKTWAPLIDRIQNLEGLHYYAIAPCGDDLFIAGERGVLFRSEDFGQNWQRLESPYEGTFFGIIGSPQGDVVMAFGLRGHVFYSFDRGETWHPSDIGINASVVGGAFLSCGSVCIAAVDGSILQSVDNGKTFTVLPNKVPGSIALVEIKPGISEVVGYRGLTQIDMKQK